MPESANYEPSDTVITAGDKKYQPSYGKNGVYTNGVCNGKEEEDEDEEFFLDTIEVRKQNISFVCG